MDWLKKIIWKRKQLSRPNEPIFVGEQVPVQESPGFINHNLFVKKHFSFLVSEYNFEEPVSSWISYEHHTQYRNYDIEIRIVFMSDELPRVDIRKITTKPSASSYHNIAELGTGEVVRKIIALRFSRLKPKTDRYHSRIRHKNTFDSRELDADFKNWGRAEHETILSEYASLIKQNPEILSGDFSKFDTISPLDEKSDQ